MNWVRFAKSEDDAGKHLTDSLEAHYRIAMVKWSHIIGTVGVVLAIKFLPLLWTIPAALTVMYAVVLAPLIVAQLNANPYSGWLWRQSIGQTRRALNSASRRTAQYVLPKPRPHRVVKVERIPAPRRAA